MGNKPGKKILIGRGFCQVLFPFPPFPCLFSYIHCYGFFARWFSCIDVNLEVFFLDLTIKICGLKSRGTNYDVFQLFQLTV